MDYTEYWTGTWRPAHVYNNIFFIILSIVIPFFFLSWMVEGKTSGERGGGWLLLFCHVYTLPLEFVFCYWTWPDGRIWSGVLPFPGLSLFLRFTLSAGKGGRLQEAFLHL